MSQVLLPSTNLRHYARSTILEFSRLTQQLFIHLAAATGDEGALGIIKPTKNDPKSTKKGPQGTDKASPQNLASIEQNFADRVTELKRASLNHLSQFDLTLHELIKCDAKIELLIESLQEHQINQAKLQHTLSLCQQETDGIFTLIEYLQTTKRDLIKTIQHAQKQIQDYVLSRERTKDTEELVDFASRIRKYTAAPPNFDPASTEVAAEPPYPDELLMRSGVLAESTANLDEVSLEDEDAAAKQMSFNFVPTINQIGMNGLSTTNLDAHGNPVANGAAEDEDDFFFDLNADLV